MKSSQTFIIIGNGVAAWRINAELERKFVDANILRIGSGPFAPACSFRTTSINSLRGTQKGISPLGDLMVDSYEEFVRFMEREAPDGVFKSFEYQIWDNANQEKWGRRYKESTQLSSVEGIELSKKFCGVKNEAYLIDPLEFYHWHKRSLSQTEEVDDFIVKAEKEGAGHRVWTQRGRSIYADKVFLCAGHDSPVFSSLITEEKCLDYLSRSKPVRGAYLISEMSGEERSFSIAIENKHLIFRNGKLIIGSLSENDSSVVSQKSGPMKELYDFVQAHLKDASILPPFEEMNVVVGARHKGPKRSPWWGVCGENLYGIFGLYKNGFSFSFKAAKDLIKEIT